MKPSSLISWISIKSRRKKKRVQLFFYLEVLRQLKFNLRTDEKKKNSKDKIKIYSWHVSQTAKIKKKAKLLVQKKKNGIDTIVMRF